MRCYFEPARLFSGGVTIEVAPDTVTALTMAGVSIEVLTHHVDGDGDYYVDTTDASYSVNTKYRLRIDSTVDGHSVTKDTNFRHVDASAVTAPAAPTLSSLANDGTGTSATATITGTAGVTYQLLYKLPTAASWTAGVTRVGSGTMTQTGLANTSLVQVQVVGTASGIFGLPSKMLSVLVTDNSLAPAYGFDLPLTYLRNALAATTAWQALVGAGNAAEALPTIHYFGLDHAGKWAAATAFALHAFIRDEANNALIFEATAAGTTGGTEPTWPTAAGGTVSDGGVTWTARANYGATDAGIARASRPFAVVGVDTWSCTRVSGGDRNYYASDGDALVYIEADVPAAHKRTVDAAGRWAGRIVGAIVDQMKALASSGGDYLDITAFDVLMFDRTPDERVQAEGDRFRVLLKVSHRSGE